MVPTSLGQNLKGHADQHPAQGLRVSTQLQDTEASSSPVKYWPCAHSPKEKTKYQQPSWNFVILARKKREDAQILMLLINDDFKLWF